MRNILLATLVVMALLLGSAATVMAESQRHVFANITTDDTNRAAMAIQFTRAIMKSKGMQATLFFNTYGVELVHAGKPSPRYADGQTIADMLRQFMDEGGTVLACPMCMKHVSGMTTADLLPGVAAREGGGVEAVTRPDTLVLSY